MSENIIKDTAINPSNSNSGIFHINFGTDERDIKAAPGSERATKDLTETLKKEFGPLIGLLPIKVEGNDILADRNRGTIQRLDKNGNPVEIVRGDKRETTVILNEDEINRIYAAYAKREAKELQDAEKTEVTATKSKRGRKPKQDKEQEDR